MVLWKLLALGGEPDPEVLRSARRCLSLLEGPDKSDIISVGAHLLQ